MKLTDQETLELTTLCSALIDGTLTEEQRARLEAVLRSSEAARRYYVRVMAQSASLHHYASEMQSEPHELAPVVHPRFRAWWAAGAFVAAACVALLLAVNFGPWWHTAPGKLKPKEFVARVTGERHARWSGALQLGDHVRRGQRLELAAGVAEITFDSGARVLLEAPASLDVNSAWASTLRHGVAKASVPPEAIGFRISNSAVEVVDLGTEFTMIADAAGATDVLVLKGEVEAAPRGQAEADTILLRQNEARRFGAAGITAVSDRDEKFARYQTPVEFARLAQPTRYVHWSFDESTGDHIHADVLGLTSGGFDATLHLMDEEAARRVHSEGRHGRALQFDGQLYAQGRFPGISTDAPHTIAFWVRVPEDAQLSDAFTMVAWATNSKKLGLRPVHINWNRNPGEGPIGALRTDFGGGCAMGMTSLRDGKWHHIAVFFAPGDDPARPVQVKQYVDGRLESSTIIPGRTRAPVGVENPAMADLVWLGTRLGTSGPRRDRFRGEIDELFIADRGLEPQEIVQLMRDNQPPTTAALAQISGPEPAP